MIPTTASAVSDGGSGSAGSAGPERPTSADASVCAFWLGPRCYALDTAIVGEIVAVETLAPVPLAPTAVLGIFNLRGASVALVDMTLALDLPDATARRGEARTALVLRPRDTTLAAVWIDRMDSVFRLGQGSFTDKKWTDEHPAVRGFFEPTGRNGLVVTVFESKAVLARMDKLKRR